MSARGKTIRTVAPQPGAQATGLWRQACTLWDAGRHRQAFNLMRRAALAGESSAQSNLGYFYEEGIGAKPDMAKALHWYRKAAARGSPAAANNIGVFYRNSGRYLLARRWFLRALSLGDADAHLELAKLSIRDKDIVSAKRHLKKLLAGEDVMPASRKKARGLLHEIIAKGQRAN